VSDFHLNLKEELYNAYEIMDGLTNSGG